MKPEVSTSTVAYTVYQVLCLGGPKTVEQIEADQLFAGWVLESRIRVSRKQLRAAMTGLVNRGRVLELGDGVYDVRDPQRRMLLSRDRGGDGWGGWKIQVRPRPLFSSLQIESV